MKQNPWQEEVRSFNALAAYLPSNLLGSIVHSAPDFKISPGWNRQPTTLLFADISGFTEMWNKVEEAGQHAAAEELTRLLNRYFSEMLQVIQQHSGLALKFGGDALLVAFQGRGQAVGAVACAAALQEVMDSYRLLHTSQGSFNLDMRLGLHCGRLHRAILGQVDSRMEYVVTGPVLHETLCTEARANKGEVLLTPELYALVKDEPDFKFGAVSRSARPYYALQNSLYWPLRPARPLYRPNPSRAALCTPYLKHFVPDLVRQRIESALRQRRRPQIEGEHRLVTCLFLVVLNEESLTGGSTVRARHYLKQLNELFGLLNRLVQQYRGTLARLDANQQGERLLILFGAPVNNEDDASRALRFTTQIFAELSELRIALRCRVGVATGLVYSTEVGSWWRREYTIMGSSINLAARLTDLAQPNQILVDQNTVEASAGRFQVSVQPNMLRLKGFPQPVPVYEVQGMHPPLQHSPEAVVPLGRLSEMHHLRRLVRQVQAEGRGGMVALHGAAGQGKTYLNLWLTRYWKKELAEGGRAFDPIMAECAPYLSLASYQPWLQVLDSLSGAALNPAQVERLASPRHQSLLALIKRLAPDVLADSWTIQHLRRPQVGYRDRGDLFKRSFFRLVARLLEAAAQEAPLLLTFDNMQWCDPASLELLEFVGRQLAAWPILICLLGRRSPQNLDGPEPGDASEPSQTVGADGPNYDWLERLGGLSLVLVLGSLRAEHLGQLIRQLLRAKYVPPVLIDYIYTHTGGNPLYVEELVRLELSAGRLKLDSQSKRLQWSENRTGPAQTATFSVKSLVMSSLDELEETEREVLRVAATIGPDFELDMLAHLLNLAEGGPTEIANYLRRLCLKDWLKTSPARPGTYSFSQPAVQQVLYESLAFSRRRELHRKIGRCLEEQGADEAQLELLAYHFGHSDQGQAAFDYLTRAGHKAFGQYAFGAALTYNELALAWLDRVRLNSEPAQLITLFSESGQAARLVSKYDRAALYFEKLLELARQGGLTASQVEGLNGLTICYRLAGRLDEALETAQQALTLARQGDRPDLLAETYDYLGGIYFLQGQLKMALSQFEQAYRLNEAQVARLKKAGAAPKQLELAQQLLAQSTGNLGLVHAATEQTGQAERYFKQAYEVVSRLNLRYLMTTLSINLGELNQKFFAAEVALNYHQQSLALAREIGTRDLECEALRNLGLDWLLQNQTERAEEYLLDAYDLADQLGATPLRQHILENLTEVMLDAGKLTRAADLLSQLYTLEDPPNTGPTVQSLQARLLYLRGYYLQAGQLLTGPVAALEETHSDFNRLWQLYFQQAQVYYAAQNWPYYRASVLKAYECNRQVAASLQGSPLLPGFESRSAHLRLLLEQPTGLVTDTVYEVKNSLFN